MSHTICFPFRITVCTTEIADMARRYAELKKMDCKVAFLSVDPVDRHQDWLEDIVVHAGGDVSIDFPLIADENREISTAYGMVDFYSSEQGKLPLTVR